MTGPGRTVAAVLAAALAGVGLTACTGGPASQAEMADWLRTVLVPAFHYVSSDKPGPDSVTYHYEDEHGLAFTARSTTGGGGPFPQRIKTTDYIAVWIDDQHQRIAEALGPYGRTDPRPFDPPGSFGVIAPVQAEFPNLAQRLTDLVNAMRVPVKIDYMAPVISFHVPAYPTGRVALYATTRLLRPDDDPLRVTDVLSQMTDSYRSFLAAGSIRRSADPAFAAQVPQSAFVVACAPRRGGPCAASTEPLRLSDGTPATTVTRLTLDEPTQTYVLPASAVDFCVPAGAGANPGNALWGIVHALGGDVRAADCAATWTLNGHTWTGRQTGGPATPGVHDQRVASARAIARDGLPVPLSASAAAGGDLTLADVAAVFGIAVDVDLTHNVQEATYLP